MKKGRLVILCVVIILLTSTVTSVINEPLRLPTYFLEKSVLSEIPYGTYKVTAHQLILKNPDWVFTSDGKESYRVAGNSYIRVYMGRYKNIFRVDVSFCLGFDENNKLIDVCVFKETDSL